MQGNHCGNAALVGRPNVGKSTLLNRLIGQKIAITSHKAQTTRHSLLGIRTEAQGQILFVDTPGLHLRGDSALNRLLNRTAQSALNDVDLVLLVIEALSWTDEDERALELVRNSGRPAMLVVNKVDQVKPKERLLPFLEDVQGKYPFLEVIPVSARKGINTERLAALVLDHLPEAPNLFPEDQVTDRSERFLAAELLREQLTRRFGDELPYAVSVEIERFEETGRLYRIGAVVWVERPGQKAILIGKAGEAMKETAKLAREAMEALFQTKVWLEVWVRVRKNWSNNEQDLARLGYFEDHSGN